MKRIFYFGLILILLSSCSTNINKIIENGDYDTAITKLVKRLAGKKNKDREDIMALELAFKKVNEQDLRLIEEYRNDGNQENWSKIYSIYQRIDNRQNKIEPLLPLVSKDDYQATFNFVNTTELKNDAKKNTAEYYYDKAQKLIQESKATGNKSAARNAYDWLRKIDQIYNNYKDKESLKQLCYKLGTVYYLVKFKNHTTQIMPIRFEDELLKIDVSNLSKNFKQFDTRAVAGTNYDYYINMNLHNLDFSPEREKSRVYDETWEETSYEVRRDNRGRPLKDSLGREIKDKVVTKYTATLEDVTQEKIATLGGRLEWFNVKTGDIEYTRPLNVEVNFLNEYSKLIKGNKDKLNDSCRKKISRFSQSFPSNESMILDAGEKMKKIVKGIIDEREN